MRWMLLVVMAAGCTSATAVMGPDGTPHYNVHCPRSMTACYGKMAEVCPVGYAIVNQSGGINAITPTANGPVGGGSFNDVLIKCRAATAAAR